MTGAVHCIVRHQRWFKIAIALLPVIVFCIFFALKKHLTLDEYHPYVLEGGVVEIITEVGYLVCSLIAFSIARSFLLLKQKIMAVFYLLLGLGLLFVFLEEISYGQRIFDFEPPEYFLENNRQNEFNYHNLKGFGITKSMWVYKLVISIYGSFALLLASFFFKRKYPDLVNWFCPGYYLVPLFISVIVHKVFVEFIVGGKPAINEIMGGVFDHFHGHEINEMLLAFGFFFFLVVNRYRITLKRKAVDAIE